MDLLLTVNAWSNNGLLFDLNGDGMKGSSEARFRTMANDVFGANIDVGGS